MAELIRTGPSARVKGLGYARSGAITTVPDGMVDALLASGEWERPGESNGAPAAPDLRTSTDPAGAPEPERVTEPAPSKPARKASRKKS